MARYDWPTTAEPHDDPGARGRHNARYLPSANVQPPEGTPMPEPPPAAARAPRARGTPHAAPSGGNGLWLPIGPTTVLGGQATGRPRVAGRIRDLAVEPTTGDRIYAASGSGGVWFSDSRGVSWRPLDEFAVSPNRDTLFPMGNTLACGAIHVQWGAAADGSADIVYVGTGEPGGAGAGAGIPGGKVKGIGVLRAVGPATGAPWVIEGANHFRGQSIWRLVGDPGQPAQLFAATDNGLFRRTAAGGWDLMTHPGAALIVDVAITRLAGPDRLRAWILSGNGLFVAEVAAPATPLPIGAFSGIQAVALNNAMTWTRFVLALGASGDLWVLGRRNRTGTENFDPAHLWRVNAGAVIGSVAATEITGAPPRLFMSASDQSWYDMCIAAHPDNGNVLYLGGATTDIGGEWNASIYRTTIAGTVATPTLVGNRVHADVHTLRVGPLRVAPNRAVWVGCDGGAFMSDTDGVADSFVPRNNDLAVLEPGFVANHATNDGIVAAGLQDNGTIERVGNTVWREAFMGDGGGVCYDPTHDRRYFRQYTNASWRSSDGSGVPPVKRRQASAPSGQQTSEAVEDAAALFYTGATSLDHGGSSHLAFGTDRVWYSNNWGGSWVTLPTGTDPRAANSPNLSQDVLMPGTANGTYTDTVPTFLCCTRDYTGTRTTGSTGITTTRITSRDDAGGNHRVSLVALWNGGLTIMNGSRATASTGAWTWAIDLTEPIRPANGATEQADVNNAAPIAFLPALAIANDVNWHDPDRGAHGSFYVATVGGPGAGAGQEIDTLWWYDGDGHFVPTGMRRAHPRSAWSGTRIAAPALSVVVDPDDSDLVYVGTSVGVVKGSLTMVDNGSGVMEPHWAWTAFDNGLPEGAVHDLAIYNHSGVKLLRAALQARGIWETDLANAVAQPNTFLRVYASDTRRRRPTPLTGPPTRGESDLRWDASPDIVFDTSAIVFGSGGASEADLFELPFAGEVAEYAAQTFEERTFKVHVLVHHRWFEALPTADVKVALLRRAAPDDGGDVPLEGIWATMISVSGGAAPPADLPGDWVKADAQLTKSPTAPIHPRTPRSVTFNVDLSALDEGDRVCFLAVVMSAQDPILAGDIALPGGGNAANVQQLVLHSRHAAARTFRVQ